MSHDAGGCVTDGIYAGIPVTVTGGTGFLGKHLAHRLVTLGARVTLLVRDPSRLDPKLRESCRVVQGDLLDRGSVREAIDRAAYVFHCAANVSTWGKWEDYFAPNVQGVDILLDVLAPQQETLRRLVHVSTVDVYGFPEKAADESSPTPVVAFGYGESKRQGEGLVRERCNKAGISYVVLRPGNIVGPGSPFVSRIGDALTSGVMLKIDAGQAHAGLIDVENLLDVLLWAAASPQADQQVFNVRDPWHVSWSEYLGGMRAGLQAERWVLNLGFREAKAVAYILTAFHSLLRLTGEPLLHSLIVHIFGRTCGHSINKLERSSAPQARVDYQTSLARSVRWFLAARIKA